MITATITREGRQIATWTEADGYAGDQLFHEIVQLQIPDPLAYDPFPELAAIQQAAKAAGLEVIIAGEPDPLPEDAVQ